MFHHDFPVPGRVPGFVSLLFWYSVPPSVPGSFWFWVRFWGLFPCSSGILFHHHAPNSSGTEWGSHFFQQSLFTFVPSGFSGSLWFPLVPARDPGFVSRRFFLLPAKGFCSILIFWLCLRKFWGLFPCSSGILFHHHAPNSSGTEWGSHFFQQSLFTFVPSGFSGSLWFPLVPARDPGFVSRLFFLLPAKGFCSILIFWLCLRKFRGLSPYSSGIQFRRQFLVRSGSG